MNSKQLEKKLAEYDKLKAEIAALKKKQDAIKVEFEKHLEDSNTKETAVGTRKICKAVSSYGIVANTLGVTKAQATNDIIKELLDAGKNNLLSIKPKVALLHKLQQQGDFEILDILSRHDVDIEEKETLKIS